MSPTLSGMQVHDAGVQVCLCSTDSPHQRWKVLVNVRDGQRLTVHCPPPHHHHKRDQIHQATRIECEELMDRVGYFQMGDLHGGKWRCKFLQMVLQYQRLCLSSRVAKSVHFVFKFCLYIVYSVLTYFRKFPVCSRLFVHQNSRHTGAVLMICWYPRCAIECK